MLLLKSKKPFKRPIPPVGFTDTYHFVEENDVTTLVLTTSPDDSLLSGNRKNRKADKTPSPAGSTKITGRIVGPPRPVSYTDALHPANPFGIYSEPKN